MGKKPAVTPQSGYRTRYVMDHAEYARFIEEGGPMTPIPRWRMIWRRFVDLVRWR